VGPIDPGLPSWGLVMSNGGGPDTLSGGNLRYVWRGRKWTVHSERAMKRVVVLAWTAIFLGLFAGLLVFAFLTFSSSGSDAWMLITAGLMFCAMLVAIYLILVIRSKSAVGVFFKRFTVRPATLDAMLQRSAENIGVELDPVEPQRLGWVPNRDWDIHRSYAIKGMDSRVNVVRKFRIRLNRVRVQSFLEMGPKGLGDDEMLDHLAKTIDSADIYGQEENLVDFGAAESRFKAWNAAWIISVIVTQFLFAIFLLVYVGLIQDETLVTLVEEYHLTLILMAMTFFISRASQKRIVVMSRQAKAI
jgi:hypothetical protein